MTWLAFVVLLASAGVEERISAEIDRLDAALAKIDESQLPQDLRGMVAPNREQLAGLKKITSPLLRLYRLREPFVGAETLQFVSNHTAATKSFDSFEALWKTRRSRFGEKRTAAKGPVLQRALVQSGTNRAEKLFRASLPYGKVDFPWSGVYYLGEAEGNLNFAGFVDSLSLPSPSRVERRPGLATLRATLDALEGETLTLFEKDPASRTSIPVSARLKETRELLDQRRIEGTTLSLLESRLGLTRRASKTRATNPATAPSLKSGQDTLIDLYVAMADEDKEGETARLVRSSVLPFYASLTNSGLAAAESAAAPVTVTLVRWPYT